MSKPIYCDGEKLKERAQQGDKKLLEDLFNCFSVELSQHLRRRCKNPEDAEDSLQDVFETVAKNINQYRGDSPIAHWLFKIASNSCFRKRRGLKNNPNIHQELDFEVHSNSDSLNSIEDIIEVRLLPLKKGFTEINELDRMVLILKDGQGLANQEIADQLNLTLSAVKSRLFRARQKIKELIT